MTRLQIGVLVVGLASAALLARPSPRPGDEQPRAPRPTSEIDRSETGPLVPAPGRTTWAPGVIDGIPVRTKTCASIEAAAFGDGTVEASAAIQRAIDRCPDGQVVSLSAGTFLMNHHVLIAKGITLRGAGRLETRLVKTNGAVARSYIVEDASPLVIVGPNRWPKADSGTSVDLTTDAEQGTRSIAVKSAKGFSRGQVVLLDQDDFSAAAWLPLPTRLASSQPASIWASDLVAFNRHDPPESTDGAFPESLTWFSRSSRPVSEVKEIDRVTGTTITFTTPVHATYTAAKRAQLTRYAEDSPHVRDAGIEDLSVSGGGDGNIHFEAAAYSWLRNVDDSFWLGDGVSINHSFRVEVRDSAIHHAAYSEPGGGGYAVSLALGSSEILIENNALHDANKVMVVRSSGAGSVVGYNYLDNGLIASIPEWIETGLNGSHMVGSHHVLFEGNQAFNYDSDNTHGSAFAMTVFRNHLVGRRSDYGGAGNQRAAGLMFGSWWHTFIGNVLGDQGHVDDWRYEDAGDASSGSRTNAWRDGGAIWRLGYDPVHWDQLADPRVGATLLRDGNFDFVTGEVRWDRAPRPLPASLYLTAKPAFFGDEPWPWVDATGTRKLGTLPARRLRGARPAALR